MKKLVLPKQLAVLGVFCIPALAWGQQDLGPGNQMRFGGMFFVLTLVVALLVFFSRRETHRNELIGRFIEKGQPVPPTLLPPPATREREIRRGIRLTGLGLGIGLALYVAMGEVAGMAWGLIPLLLGVACFINAVFFYPASVSQRTD